jgi:hypothetical protein
MRLPLGTEMASGTQQAGTGRRHGKDPLRRPVWLLARAVAARGRRSVVRFTLVRRVRLLMRDVEALVQLYLNGLAGARLDVELLGETAADTALKGDLRPRAFIGSSCRSHGEGMP